MNFESAKAKTVDICTKLFCGGMILFYVLWIMFHDESGTSYPAKFEIVLLMIVVSVLCNIGFYISLGNCKRKFKKSVITLLLIAAFFNFFMFISFSHTPFEHLDEVQWSVLRMYLAYGSVLFSLVISVFVLRYKK
jgi:cytochrome bd-type quinol oxidase subunit 2